MRIQCSGEIVMDEDKWLYDWCEIPSFSPGDLRNAIEKLADGVARRDFDDVRSDGLARKRAGDKDRVAVYAADALSLGADSVDCDAEFVIFLDGNIRMLHLSFTLSFPNSASAACKNLSVASI